MKNLIIIEENRVTDCDFLIGKAENTLHSLENCLETVIDDKKSKMNVIGSIFSFGFSLTKLTFSVAGCAVKNVPKAVVAVAAGKKEIITDLENGYREYQKELKENALEEKIEQIALKKKEDENMIKLLQECEKLIS